MSGVALAQAVSEWVRSGIQVAVQQYVPVLLQVPVIESTIVYQIGNRNYWYSCVFQKSFSDGFVLLVTIIIANDQINVMRCDICVYSVSKPPVKV